jgi:hypothetical protein
MPKYLFAIHDQGEYKKINSATIRDNSFDVDPNLFYETDQVDFFNTVRELIKDNEVKYPSAWAGKLTLSNLIQTKYDPLQLKKMDAISRGTLLISQRINVFSLMGFAKFIILNNYLADKGLFITDENREEKYLEIINTNDSSLISKLEEYLEIKDDISQDLYWYEHYNSFKNSIQSASTEEDVNTLIETFSGLFN